MNRMCRRVPTMTHETALAHVGLQDLRNGNDAWWDITATSVRHEPASEASSTPIYPRGRLPQMDSKPPIGKRFAPVEVKTVTRAVPRIPQDTIDEILNHLATDAGFGSLQACALVSKSWISSCRRYLFYTVDFTSRKMNKWLKTFPIPEQSPAHHVRNLRVWISRIPEELFKYTVHFKNVCRLSLVGWEKLSGCRLPSLWRLPESVTSLTIDAGRVTLVEIRDIMLQLPNLDDLSLPGPLTPSDRRELLGIGAALRGTFGGKLALHSVRYDNRDVVTMLLEIPTGLRFTEVEIYCTRECLPSVVKLVDACCKTIVRLSHTVDSYGKYNSFSWSG